MAPLKNKDFENDSGSEEEKSSGSDSESSGSGSDSDSKSEAGSVASHRSGASGSRPSSRSAPTPDNEEHSSRSASAQSKSSSENEGNLVLDESKGRSRSTSRSSRGSSRSGSAASDRSDKSERSGKSEKSDKSGKSEKSVKSNRSTKSDRSEKSEKSRKTDKSDDENEGKDTAHSSPAPDDEPKKKSKRIVDSDASGSDSDASGKKGETSATAEALFGEGLDISSEDDDDRPAQKLPKKISSDEEQKDEEMDQDDEDRDNEKDKEPEEPVPETRIEHEIPYIRADVGKEFHFVKLPNFLSVEPRPFDPETYEDELEEEETLDEEGRARLKLKVENTIRWRTAFDKDGNAFKESNARMVKWSDGSLSLHLGSEIFDVYRQPLQGDHNHLFIRQGTGLQGQAVFRTKLTFRPHSTDSFTHRKMTKSLAERSTKTSAVKIISAVGADPEAHRGEMIKKEEEKLRASMRRESKQKRIRERTATGRGMSGSYLEPDRDGYEDSDDEGAISLTAIKNKYKKGGDLRPSIYSSEDDASDIEERKAKKLDRPKALRDSDDEDDEGTSGGKVRVVSSGSEEESD